EYRPCRTHRTRVFRGPLEPRSTTAALDRARSIKHERATARATAPLVHGVCARPARCCRTEKLAAPEDRVNAPGTRVTAPVQAMRRCQGAPCASASCTRGP